MKFTADKTACKKEQENAIKLCGGNLLGKYTLRLIAFFQFRIEHYENSKIARVCNHYLY